MKYKWHTYLYTRKQNYYKTGFVYQCIETIRISKFGIYIKNVWRKDTPNEPWIKSKYAESKPIPLNIYKENLRPYNRKELDEDELFLELL